MTVRAPSPFNPFALLLFLAGGLAGPTSAGDAPEAPPAQPRVDHREEIVLGSSMVLTGPAADLGTNMLLGIRAALDEANRGGGVQGRPLRIVALDDGYEPAKAIPNMRRLIDKEKVTAIVGNVGTPTAVASIPIAVGAKTPFFGAFSGAGVLRKTPPDRYVINYRASYAEETGAMVDALIDRANLRPCDIAFFTQRDAYGDAGFAGGMAALKRHGLADESAVSHVRYERNTLAVELALSELLLRPEPPSAVIMVGAYAPCAAFIEQARKNELKALFLNVSFVGSESLARALGPAGNGVIVTQTVPHYDSDLPIAHDYLAALKATDPDASPTFGAMEGYVSTRLFLAAIGRPNAALDREGVTLALEHAGKVELGLGASLELNEREHQACHTVWPTVIRDGKVVPFGWEDLTPEGVARYE